MRKFVWISLLCVATLPTLACDLCGCSNGGSFFGILPQGHRKFLGVRYRYSSFYSHVGSVNLNTREDFRTTELWGRFYPVRRMQVLAFVPYQFNQQTMLKTGQATPLHGLGDVSALVQYNLLNTFMDDSAGRLVDHNLLLGGGVKLPTGRYHYDETSAAEVANANFQLGTGSTDFLLSAIYTARYRNWGTNLDASYRLTTSNPNGYRFGNRVNASASVFYVAGTGNRSVVPNAGVFVEQANHDRLQGEVNRRTGGYATFLSAGVELYLNKFSLGASYRHPLGQNLSDGEVRANAQLSTHVTFLF